ncbi:ATP-dependent DNA helicase PIF1-like [Galendromus occidentalis]|uniref:ATP-dependent DNA helicase n=1 Tax=Galendromus occidentalis TaxID=34638 RepID=A0AAJ7WH43_9ACAR|nr:ATP-dependent DNA helicase PIF1-like [Galendromus occidentalis]
MAISKNMESAQGQAHGAERARDLERKLRETVDDFVRSHEAAIVETGIPLDDGSIQMALRYLALFPTEEIDINSFPVEYKLFLNIYGGVRLPHFEVCGSRYRRRKGESDADHLVALQRNYENLCGLTDAAGAAVKSYWFIAKVQTYLYNSLYNLLVGQRKQVLCVAWTGIAANLSPGGRTVSSIFKLNMHDDNRSSSMKRQHKEAVRLAQLTLLIWDEISMVPKRAFEAVDALFRDIRRNEDLSGGRTVVLGGDFRQTLPIVGRGSVDDIIQACVIESKSWSHFSKYELTENVQARESGTDWHKFLLDVGNGVANDSRGKIFIEPAMMCKERIADEIFGARIAENPIDDLVDTFNPTKDAPHELHLKKGAIVLLLRNLDISNKLCNGTRWY